MEVGGVGGVGGAGAGGVFGLEICHTAYVFHLRKCTCTKWEVPVTGVRHGRVNSLVLVLLVLVVLVMLVVYLGRNPVTLPVLHLSKCTKWAVSQKTEQRN